MALAHDTASQLNCINDDLSSLSRTCSRNLYRTHTSSLKDRCHKAKHSYVPPRTWCTNENEKRYRFLIVSTAIASIAVIVWHKQRISIRSSKQRNDSTHDDSLRSASLSLQPKPMRLHTRLWPIRSPQFDFAHQHSRTLFHFCHVLTRYILLLLLFYQYLRLWKCQRIVKFHFILLVLHTRRTPWINWMLILQYSLSVQFKSYCNISRVFWTLIVCLITLIEFAFRISIHAANGDF